MRKNYSKQTNKGRAFDDLYARTLPLNSRFVQRKHIALPNLSEYDETKPFRLNANLSLWCENLFNVDGQDFIIFDPAIAFIVDYGMIVSATGAGTGTALDYAAPGYPRVDLSSTGVISFDLGEETLISSNEDTNCDVTFKSPHNIPVASNEGEAVHHLFGVGSHLAPQIASQSITISVIDDYTLRIANTLAEVQGFIAAGNIILVEKSIYLYDFGQVDYSDRAWIVKWAVNPDDPNLKYYIATDGF